MHSDLFKKNHTHNRDGRDNLTNRIDFIVCLGGDGTLLYASLLFQESVPPVMAFHLGSLGFLTPFRFDNFQKQVTKVLEGDAALTLRSRLRCIIVRKSQDKQQSKLPCDRNDSMAHRAIANDTNDLHQANEAKNGSPKTKQGTNILVINIQMNWPRLWLFSAHTRTNLMSMNVNRDDFLMLWCFSMQTGAQRSGY